MQCCIVLLLLLYYCIVPLLLSHIVTCQALKTDTVSFLVRLLETGLENQEKPAATKAQIVKALKAMQRSLKYGEEVK